MIPGHCLERIHQERCYGFDLQDQRLIRLAQIELKVQDFLINQEVASERAWLVRSIGEERIDRAVANILHPNQPNSTVKNIASIKEKLSHLITQLKDNASCQGAKLAFQDLPYNVQDLFYWAVWVHHGSPIEDKCGAKKVKEHISLLCEIQSPLLF